MTITKLKEQILEVLKTDDRVWAVGADDKKELNQTSLLSLVEKIDENIIQLLLEDDNIRDKFFVKIKDVYVFKTNDFVFFMEENKVNNMYTQYKNQIGLTDGKRFIDDSKDVVLNWPFKDCILEGGQSTEEGMDNYFQWQETTMKDKLDDKGNKIKDGRKNIKEVDVEGHYEQKQAKRKEIFFNEIIAADEIDRLEEPKAFVNWKRHTTKGEEAVKELKRDEDGTIKDNLIIKGNNLLALHSLKKEFAGKVQLIYIDPPYNTGNDGFQYNDNYNHSSWLTFMKNRLDIAKILLKEDGLIFINIDHFENHYLKLLLDSIFGRDQFVNQIVWKRRGGSMNQPNCYGNVVDYILMYSKNDKYKFFPQKSLNDEHTQKYIKERFNNKDSDGRLFMKSPMINPSFRPTMMYDYKGYKSPEKGWLVNLEKMVSLDKQNRLFFPENKNHRISRKIYLDEYEGQPVDCLWTDINVINPMSKEALNFVGQKPEKLIHRIISSATNKGDIILDFHLGSGTTAAVAHKMDRQYICIEQMDYIDNCVKRLKTVIGSSNKDNGQIFESLKVDESGVTQLVDWKGGGDFIYCELAKWNETAKDKINDFTSLDKLIEFFDTLYYKYFLNYNLKIKEFKEKVITEDNFKKLSLEEQKCMFLSMLDLNQMYVNESEMEDTKYDLSDDDIALTKQFYNKED